MVGRDIHETGRVATPLELLFDLTFVVAFAFAASEFAHAVAAGHLLQGLIGFAIGMFGVVWAWINYSWFASAFDTDDSAYRLMTMLQMVGVLILALGIAPMFASLEGLGHGGHIDITVVVLGYVVMRIAMVGQWVRAGVQDPAYSASARSYVLAISIAQLGWVLAAMLQLSIVTFLVCAVLLIGVELLGPVFAERRHPTPWHAHHIAERYSLLVIIALGEVITGTVAALAAVVEVNRGWDLSAALVGLAGVGVTLAMWWTYFSVPFAEVLHADRGKAFGFGYGHFPIYVSIAAVGAGLHVVALQLEGGHGAEGAHGLGTLGAIAWVVAPLTLFVISVFGLWAHMLQTFHRVYLAMLLAAAVGLAVPVLLAAAHAPVAACLAATLIAPVLIVVGHERFGRAHTAALVQKL